MNLPNKLKSILIISLLAITGYADDRLVLLSASYGKNIVAICDSKGQPIWEYKTKGGPGHSGHHDIHLLANGNILFHDTWTHILEITLDKKIVWEYDSAKQNVKEGAEVHAFDISPDIIEIAKDHSNRFNYKNVHFNVMPSEAIKYNENFFDLIFCLDILHHVDISESARQFQRVLKPGGRIIGNELYTYSHIEHIVRRSYLVEKVIYPRMVKYIYGTDQPYITQDEHKIDDAEFTIIRDMLKECRMEYFNIFVGRIVPERSILVSKFDRTLARAVGGLGHFLAGRIVFDGVIRKKPSTPTITH